MTGHQIYQPCKSKCRPGPKTQQSFLCKNSIPTMERIPILFLSIQRLHAGLYDTVWMDVGQCITQEERTQTYSRDMVTVYHGHQARRDPADAIEGDRAGQGLPGSDGALDGLLERGVSQEADWQ